MTERTGQRGAVSLFVVIFSALLIITVVTSFMRIMIQDQMQATASDLSRSAYDSAQAGVEDVKRAVTEYLSCASPSRCSALEQGLGVGTGDWTTGCEATITAGVASVAGAGSREVPVTSNTGPDNKDLKLDQAYTCVKVNMQPDDVIGDNIYPLRSVDNDPIDSIEIEWSLQKDTTTFDLGTIGQTNEIPSAWSTSKPSILRAQLIQYENDFLLSQFDAENQTIDSTADSKVYNKTLFFVPYDATSLLDSPIPLLADDFESDARPSSQSTLSSDAIIPGKCRKTVEAGNYACKAVIKLPVTTTLPDGTNAARNAYLRVDRLYPAGDDGAPKVAMKNGASAVPFDRVQVAVDVTGRANDIFKRIRTRLDIGGANLPLMAVDTTKSICKDFVVTDSQAYPVLPRPTDQLGRALCPELPN